jgi:uncharacterized membrane protein (DUF4010 family)
MMYLRLAVLLALFNQELMERLALPFVLLALLAIGAGWLWSRRTEPAAPPGAQALVPKNPLELSAALIFALLFVAMLMATHLAVTYLGNPGVYALAAIMGISDVDPFIIGLTQSAPALTPLPVAATGILIAAASNNVAKGLYAFALAPRPVGRQSLYFLLALAVLGLSPLLGWGAVR